MRRGIRKREETAKRPETTSLAREKRGSGKDDKQVPAEAGGAAAVAIQAASDAHTAQLRAILDHLVHASCWKSAVAVSRILARRSVPLRCAVQPEGTLETKIDGGAGDQDACMSSGSPMDVEEEELPSGISCGTLDAMQHRHATVELMLTGKVEEVRFACYLVMLCILSVSYTHLTLPTKA